MPLESSTTIANLDASWPLSTDFILDGDDHTRLIKSVLKAQFPGASGNGFAIPIIAHEDEINHLSGVTGNVQSQIDAIIANDNLIAPSGTVMTFFQGSPPLGWTVLTGLDNSMMRIVDANGGGYGGTDSPISFSTSHNHTTGSLALTLAQMPRHRHYTTQVWANVSGHVQEDGDGHNHNMTVSTRYTDYQGSTQAHNHGSTSTVGQVYNFKYANLMLATKD